MQGKIEKKTTFHYVINKNIIVKFQYYKVQFYYFLYVLFSFIFLKMVLISKHIVKQFPLGLS